MKYFLLGIIFVITAFIFTHSVNADKKEKILWCHTEPNGNQQTLNLPQEALENAGHMSADGNPLHAGDHLGACVEIEPTEPVSSSSATLTPTVPIDPIATPEATLTPGQTATPTESSKNEDKKEEKPVLRDVNGQVLSSMTIRK